MNANKNLSGKTTISCSLVEMTEIYKEVVEECRRNVNRAIIDHSPYNLDETFSHLKVPESAWKEFDEKKKTQCIRKIDPVYKGEESQNQAKNAETQTIGPFEASGLPSMFKVPWTNAQLIVKKNGVGKAPGSEGVRVVLSIKDANTPHTVKGQDSFKKLRCNCKGFEVRGLCAHAITVAYHEGSL